MKLFYLGENGQKVFFNDLSISGIYILKGFQDDADRGRVSVRVGSALCPVCWVEDNRPLILDEMSEVVFPNEKECLGIKEEVIFWCDTESEILYAFNNNDDLVFQKSCQEVDKIFYQLNSKK